MASSSTKVTLKLLIDTKNNRVLFAEASKAVIDFLFNLLRLPVGTVVKLLRKNNMMVGSLGNLYESVENLDANYMQPDQINKDVLLNPRAPISPAEVSGQLLPSNNDAATMGTLFYMCRSYCSYDVTCDNTTPCFRCTQPMNRQIRYVERNVNPERVSNGFVKDVVTFMVMDDLVIQPMSTISSITLLNKLFNIKDVGALQEKVVEMGMDEGIKLLKTYLQSEMVLTSVFIKKQC